MNTTGRRASTQFHHVTYREANALREAAGHPAATPLGMLGHVRILTVFRSRTPLRGRGSRCRECGERIGPREEAIAFAFAPYATAEEPETGYIANQCWLHLGPCETPRQLR